MDLSASVGSVGIHSANTLFRLRRMTRALAPLESSAHKRESMKPQKTALYIEAERWIESEATKRWVADGYRSARELLFRGYMAGFRAAGKKRKGNPGPKAQS